MFLYACSFEFGYSSVCIILLYFLRMVMYYLETCLLSIYFYVDRYHFIFDRMFEVNFHSLFFVTVDDFSLQGKIRIKNIMNKLLVEIVLGGFVFLKLLLCILYYYGN